MPILYAVAGVYIVGATGLLVYGALPDSLAQNGGAGSTKLRESFSVLRDSRYAETDVVAGAWAFAAFMCACLAFGVIDLIAEPSSLALLFALHKFRSLRVLWRWPRLRIRKIRIESRTATLRASSTRWRCAAGWREGMR